MRLAVHLDLGQPFDFSASFCSGWSRGIGSPLWDTSLLLAFALGRAMPIAMGAGAVGALEKLRPPARYQRAFDIAGGVALVVMGLYMLNAYLSSCPSVGRLTRTAALGFSPA